MTKSIDIGNYIIVTNKSHLFYTEVGKILRTSHNSKNGRLLRCRVRFDNDEVWISPLNLDLVSFKFYLRRKLLNCYE